MKTLRPHRFPPLAQLHALAPRTGGNALQASLAQGFEEGLSKGYDEGYASGLKTGQDEARAAARQVGLAEGRAQAQAQLAQPLDTLDALIVAVRQLQQDCHASMRREVVDLVERVARQVIRAELTLRPNQLLALVDETLAAMPPARDGVEIFLNPEDLVRLQDLAPRHARTWELHADKALGVGECRVIAAGREADAGCAQRLAACMTQVSAQLAGEAAATAEEAA